LKFFIYLNTHFPIKKLFLYLKLPFLYQKHLKNTIFNPKNTSKTPFYPQKPLFISKTRQNQSKTPISISKTTIFRIKITQKTPFLYQNHLKTPIFLSKTTIFISKSPQKHHFPIKNHSKTTISLSKSPQIRRTLPWHRGCGAQWPRASAQKTPISPGRVGGNSTKNKGKIGQTWGKLIKNSAKMGGYG
jgi:hypothetical protein